MANSHSRRNFITKIRVNGAILMEVGEIKDGKCKAFHVLLSEMTNWRPSIRGLCSEELESDSSTSLEKLFSYEKVFDALSNLGGNKAPGSYGFPMAFWKFCWDFVKSEIMGFFRKFFTQDIF